jgi:hypothetical protein
MFEKATTESKELARNTLTYLKHGLMFGAIVGTVSAVVIIARGITK